MIFFDKERILGWNSPSIEELALLSRIRMENQFDLYNRPNWIWRDYPEGEPVYSPQPYTPEHLEIFRVEWVRSEIEALYPQDIQLKIMMEQFEKPEAYTQRQADRERIKKESHKKDFQISNEMGT